MSENNRHYQRYPVEKRVTITFTDRKALKEAYVKDISNGGLFIATETPFDMRTHIAISLAVENQGELTLTGEVVHVVTKEQAASWGGLAGVGVQFSNLDQTKRKLLEAYIDGIRTKLTEEIKEAPPKLDTALLEAVEAGQREGKLYDVLGIDVMADDTEIAVAAEMRFQALVALGQNPSLPAHLQGRVTAARNAVDRANAVLMDERKRAHYLFRSGLLALDKLAEILVEMPAAREEIASYWEQAFPAQAQAGHRLAEIAIRAARENDHRGARQSAKIALSQNPFLFKLRDALRTWDE